MSRDGAHRTDHRSRARARAHRRSRGSRVTAMRPSWPIRRQLELARREVEVLDAVDGLERVVRQRESAESSLAPRPRRRPAPRWGPAGSARRPSEAAGGPGSSARCRGPAPELVVRDQTVRGVGRDLRFRRHPVPPLCPSGAVRRFTLMTNGSGAFRRRLARITRSAPCEAVLLPPPAGAGGCCVQRRTMRRRPPSRIRVRSIAGSIPTLTIPMALARQRGLSGPAGGEQTVGPGREQSRD